MHLVSGVNHDVSMLAKQSISEVVTVVITGDTVVGDWKVSISSFQVDQDYLWWIKAYSDLRIEGFVYDFI